MIEFKKVDKGFNETIVLKQLNMTVNSGSIFGLIGPNGSGKSTILRLTSGIYRADGGYITVDNQSVFENIAIKQQIMLVGDEPYFLPQSNLLEMKKFYQLYYDEFNEERYQQLLTLFKLNEKAKLLRFSKGMKRQAALVLALSVKTKVLLLDEAFDGLDPVMRMNLKRMLIDNIEQFQQTIIISSHNLRELEDICDTIGMIHDGQMLLLGASEELLSQVHKVQLSFSQLKTPQDFQHLPVMHYEQRGRVTTLILRGAMDALTKQLEAMQPLLMDVLPVNLEELFVYELEAQGYGK